MNKPNPWCDSSITPKDWAMSLHIISHGKYWITSKSPHTDIQGDWKAGLTFKLGTSPCHIHTRSNPQSVYFSFNLKYLPTVYKNKEVHIKSRFSSCLENHKLWQPSTLGPLPACTAAAHGETWLRVLVSPSRDGLLQPMSLISIYLPDPSRDLCNCTISNSSTSSVCFRKLVFLPLFISPPGLPSLPISVTPVFFFLPLHSISIQRTYTCKIPLRCGRGIRTNKDIEGVVYFQVTSR